MNESKKIKTKEICFCGMMVAIMAVCSWISIPLGQVPFTLQTFAVFVAIGLLGGKLGTIAVTVYVLLGTIGVPVFAGFSGGPSAILGTSGGYIIGFIFSALIMWLFEKLFGKGIVSLIISMIVGLIVCYAVGTVWFMVVYTHTTGAVTLGATLGWCVIPFIIPDAVKILCAALISGRLRKVVSNMIGTKTAAA